MTIVYKVTKLILKILKIQPQRIYQKTMLTGRWVNYITKEATIWPYWLGITDIDEEGIWVNHFTKEEVINIEWNGGPTGINRQVNCVWYYPFVSLGKIIF